MYICYLECVINGYNTHQKVNHCQCVDIFLAVMSFSGENDRMPVSRRKTYQKVAGII